MTDLLTHPRIHTCTLFPHTPTNPTSKLPHLPLIHSHANTSILFRSHPILTCILLHLSLYPQIKFQCSLKKYKRPLTTCLTLLIWKKELDVSESESESRVWMSWVRGRVKCEEELDERESQTGITLRHFPPFSDKTAASSILLECFRWLQRKSWMERNPIREWRMNDRERRKSMLVWHSFDTNESITNINIYSHKRDNSSISKYFTRVEKRRFYDLHTPFSR